MTVVLLGLTCGGPDSNSSQAVKPTLLLQFNLRSSEKKSRDISRHVKMVITPAAYIQIH